jgi:enamine deaminase RidA (YjgF/YER057c/UK114 family)
VRVQNAVWIAGTTATDEHGRVHGDTAAAQTDYILQKIAAALDTAGASLADVVRTRVYIVRMEDWEAVARVHGKVFGAIRPANSLIQVTGLVGGGIVEIEADAVIQDPA